MLTKAFKLEWKVKKVGLQNQYAGYSYNLAGVASPY